MLLYADEDFFYPRVKLSRRDSLRVLDLLENPPAPNAKLRRAARAMPDRS